MSASLGESIAAIRTPNLAICVGAGAAVFCAGAYVIFGDNLFRTRGQCPGLRNLGNSCYVNCILQSLASLPEVHDWLRENTGCQGAHLIKAASNLITELTQETVETCSARDVLLALKSHHWAIDVGQQDAQEFFLVLMSTIDEEMMTICPSLVDIVKEDTATCKRVWCRSGLVPVPFRKNFSSPFRGMLGSELYCMKCTHIMPLKHEFFDCISLILPKYECTLENSLLEFVKSEVVDDVTCPRCTVRAATTVKQKHLKRMQVKRLPPVLCIHLKRSMWQMDGTVVKDNSHMVFPVVLNTSGLLRRPSNAINTPETWYRLHAVVEHKGGPSSGHYVTYRRTGRTRREWVRASDRMVVKSSLREVQAAEAYMLFYCRRQ